MIHFCKLVFNNSIVLAAGDFYLPLRRNAEIYFLNLFQGLFYPETTSLFQKLLI